MMELIFSTLIAPYLPYFKDPNVAHEPQMQLIEKRLEDSRNPPTIDPTTVQFSPSKPEPLPNISGRLLAQSITPKPAVGDSVNAVPVMWSLKGILKVGGQRMAVVSDGKDEHIVALGGLIDKKLRVESLDERSITLMPISRSMGDRMRLQLAAQ